MSNETLASFLIRRRREVAEAKAALLSQLAALDAERDQIDKAASAAGIEEPVEPEGRTTLGASPPSPERPRQRIVADKTIKEAVVEILRETGEGMSALQILALVNENLKVEYPRTSLSPQLSRLKADGILVRNGVLWSLAQAPQIKEAPTGGTEGASKSEERASDEDHVFE